MSQLKRITKLFNQKEFKTIHAQMSMAQYMDLCIKKPKLARNAWQMIFDMIIEKGSSEYEEYRKTYTKYNFFDDPDLPIIGLIEAKDSLVKFIKGAAGHYGTERRVLLFHGPVGSAKSTLCRLLKKGLEKYSKTDAGAWYTYKWVNLPIGKEGIYSSSECNSALNENPLKLLDIDSRHQFIEDMNNVLIEQTPENKKAELYALKCEGELNPRCKFFMNYFLDKYEGNLEKVLQDHIVVVRKTYSEVDRCGIATFQPKDEKNQDSTELTGDINFALISLFGSDSDPRAFNFDGEFCVGNRGMIEFIEALKLDQAFLYDLLGASQEQSIKPKKFSQILIDEAIFCHTNNAEFSKLQSNQYMEALKDRTVKIDIPYTKKWSEEIAILVKDYGPGKVKQHVAPHTLEIAALWSVLSRLQDDKDGKLNLLEKAELYDNIMMENWTTDGVKEMMDKYPEEGMTTGVSPRYVQDKLSNCLSNNHEYVSPFMIINELRDGLYNSSLLSNKDQISRYMTCADLAIKKLTEILKNEVQNALIGDVDSIARLCSNYIENVIAFNNKLKVKNKITGLDQKPNEKLMRQIEEKIDVPDNGAPEFRREIAAFMGGESHAGKSFRWDSNSRLKKAFQMKLFEDIKDTLKLSLNTDGSNVVDKETQAKIDSLKARMISQYGYNDRSATDVLEFVSGVFSQGDADEE